MHTFERIKVHQFEDRRRMGAAAADQVAARIHALLQSKEEISMIFAAAPSQQEFLEAFRADVSIPWHRIHAFHMDEYLGLPAEAPQGFGNFLKDRLFGLVPFKSVHYLNGQALFAAAECARYANLLQGGTDIVCMGVGENTHIAFNDPHVADFNDPVLVKVVDLDEACRRQQVNDGCFATLEEVPTHALTLTVPALFRADYIFCMVPGPAKAAAIRHTLHSPVSGQHPSTILRTHPHAELFIDKDSGSLL
ncbi:glucosamine-6-phosphate deaminase [Chitinophaga deserti]|uniref:glucosamine-6-phosphate deaminase n=1 Tax=Chitinophaga deserti TaxID=2164099 RepID=UPI0018E58BC4|nr:glucosamine-6-phosphate deaminase [Chitinophaga deserti]